MPPTLRLKNDRLKFYWVSRLAGLSLGRFLIDGASVKGGLLSHGLKPNFHRNIGQLRRPLPRFFVHKWRACKDGDYVHAKRNDKNVPLNSRLPKNGKASHTVVSQK